MRHIHLAFCPIDEQLTLRLSRGAFDFIQDDLAHPEVVLKTIIARRTASIAHHLDNSPDPSYSFRLDKDDVADLLLRFVDIDDIEVSIIENDVPQPSVGRDDGAYNIDPSTAVALVVSCTSLAASAMALATSFLEYFATKQGNSSNKPRSTTEPTIVINQMYVIRPSNGPKAEDIASYLVENHVDTIDFL